MPPKPYHSITIAECGEPLQEIPAHFLRLTPHPYVAVGADYAGRSPFVLRQTVVAKLDIAQHYVRQQQPDWGLLVFDAFRPIAVQQYMVDYTFRQFLEQRDLQSDMLTPEQRDAVMGEVLMFWAIPSHDPATPPPHSTGAAIDVTLADGQGNAINMGSPIDEISERAQPHYFHRSQNPHEQQFHRHRRLLCEAMEAAGFIGHLNEWWHFSYGDQIWAWQLQERLGEAQRAIYGAVVEGSEQSAIHEQTVEADVRA